MALKYSAGLRDAQNDRIGVTLGTGAILKIRTGAPPADVATADSGSVLATVTLPGTNGGLAASSAGVVAKTGTWEDTSADAAGTAGHFRIYLSNGTTAHIQGTVTATGGGGDMTVDNAVFASGQAFTVSSFSITRGNA